jgi:hypothetical protein
MPRPYLKLNKYRDEIYTRIFDDKDILDDIIFFLQNEKRITITRKTIQRRYTK